MTKRLMLALPETHIEFAQYLAKTSNKKRLRAYLAELLQNALEQSLTARLIKLAELYTGKAIDPDMVRGTARELLSDTICIDPEIAAIATAQNIANSLESHSDSAGIEN